MKASISRLTYGLMRQDIGCKLEVQCVTIQKVSIDVNPYLADCILRNVNPSQQQTIFLQNLGSTNVLFCFESIMFTIDLTFG